MVTIHRISWGAILGGCILIAGCTGEAAPKNQPKVFPVTGKVTYKGSAVAGATVTFNAAGAGHSAFGLTKDDGTYQLKTFGSTEGAVPGDYKVTVVKTDAPASIAAVSTDSPDYKPPTANEAPPPPPKSLLPEKYGKAGTTDLTGKVKDGGPSTIDFELKD